jgi:hypothetical protein
MHDHQIYPPAVTLPADDTTANATRDGIAAIVWVVFFTALATAPALIIAVWKWLL